LAQEKGLHNLDWVVITTARGAVETQVLITERLRPFDLDGRRVYQIGLPWHFGWQGYATGDIVNTLSAIVGDPNTTIHEGKAFTCNLRKGRLKHAASILPGMIPQEAELTAGTRVEPGRSYGFFTDTTLCIGCKACEVAGHCLRRPVTCSGLPVVAACRHFLARQPSPPLSRRFPWQHAKTPRLPVPHAWSVWYALLAARSWRLARQQIVIGNVRVLRHHYSGCLRLSPIALVSKAWA
jgi:hypothetical protein